MRAVLPALLLVMTTSCGPLDRLRDAVAPRPPYERYLSALTAAGLHRTPAGIQWLEAGTKAVASPVDAVLPHREALTFVQEAPAAVARRVFVQRGRVYRVSAETSVDSPLNLFIDVFRTTITGGVERIAGTGPPVRHLDVEPEEDAALIVRVQPELLRGGRLTIEHSDRPALLFPVPGHGRQDVRSFFDAPRDGGRRSHQGIDIFAPRGTPAVAVADAWVSSTSPNQLGGNVVWLWDPERRHTLYYAHLDSQSVARGDRVRKGDVVGMVGNTGNARGTGPHLHFGIYRRGEGAIDPLHYVTTPKR